MVNWVTIIVILATAIIVLELFKHLFMRKLSKWMIVLVVLLILLLVLSSYVDTSFIKKSNNKILATGASIFSDIGDAVSNNLEQANYTIPFKNKS